MAWGRIARAGLDEEQMATVERDILVPILDALKREGIVYRGVLYAGLMLTKAGPKVLEFNCRFGDRSANRCWPGSKGTSSRSFGIRPRGTWPTPPWSLMSAPACCVVCAARATRCLRKRQAIQGIEAAQQLGAAGEQVIVFHAGTKHEGGELVTSGGRVLGVTALAKDLDRARALPTKPARPFPSKGRSSEPTSGPKLLQKAKTAQTAAGASTESTLRAVASPSSGKSRPTLKRKLEPAMTSSMPTASSECMGSIEPDAQALPALQATPASESCNNNPSAGRPGNPKQLVFHRRWAHSLCTTTSGMAARMVRSNAGCHLRIPPGRLANHIWANRAATPRPTTPGRFPCPHDVHVLRSADVCGRRARVAPPKPQCLLDHGICDRSASTSRREPRTNLRGSGQWPEWHRCGTAHRGTHTAPMSAMGWTTPVSLLAHITLTNAVLSGSAAMASSTTLGRTMPQSSTEVDHLQRSSRSKRCTHSRTAACSTSATNTRADRGHQVFPQSQGCLIRSAAGEHNF